MLRSLGVCTGPDRLAVHVFHVGDLTRATEAGLCSIAAEFGVAIDVVSVSEHRLRELPVTGRFPAVTWLRVLLPELLPDLDGSSTSTPTR